MALSADESWAATAGDDGELRCWSTTGDGLLTRIIMAAHPICLAIDANHLLAGNRNGGLTVFDLGPWESPAVSGSVDAVLDVRALWLPGRPGSPVAATVTGPGALPASPTARQLIAHALARHNGGSLTASALKSRMLSLDPSFDEKQQGYESFRAFLKNFPDIVRFAGPYGGDILVAPAEPTEDSQKTISASDKLVMCMTDPLSAAALGAIAITQGIKFLYEQAGEVLKRWRERRDPGTVTAGSAALRTPEGLLAGTVDPVEPRDDVTQSLRHELSEARKALADYADGIEVPQPGDQHVVAQADALRRLLEAAYGQRITFRGEDRPLSGPLVTGEIDVRQVLGDAAAVRAKKITSGNVRGVVHSERVEEGARLTGVEADDVG